MSELVLNDLEREHELSGSDMSEIEGGVGVMAAIEGAAAIIAVGQFVIGTAQSGDSRLSNDLVPIITDDVKNAGKNARNPA